MRRATAALALAALLAGCAHGGARAPEAAGAPRAVNAIGRPSVADSVTVALYRFDERGGLHVADAGPFRLAGVAGVDTRPDFGRYDGGRAFPATVQSWVYVAYNPALETSDAFTIEAWVNLSAVGSYELSMIAARWSLVPNEQSWLLGVVGNRLSSPAVPVDSPGTFDSIVSGALAGHLVFAFQPATAAAPLAFSSSAPLPIGRWTHVAASNDGSVVRLFVNGRLDAQYAIHGTIRATQAPLVIGDAFDERRLSDFNGDLQLDPGLAPTPFYAFSGTLDELRLSSAARTSFEGADIR